MPGHNLDSLVTPELRKSADNFAADDVLAATFPVREPSFFGTIAETFSPCWRLKFAGGPNTNGSAWLGELVLGQALALRQVQDWGWGSRWRRRQAVAFSGVGARQTFSRTKFADRTPTLRFQQDDEAAFQELLEHVIVRGQNGALPAVCVPSDVGRDVVLGHGEAEVRVDYLQLSQWSQPVTVEFQPVEGR